MSVEVNGNNNRVRQYLLNVWEHFTDENIAFWTMTIFCYLSMFFFVWTTLFALFLAEILRKIVGASATTIPTGQSIPITVGALISSLAITFSVCALIPMAILLPKVWKKVREKKQSKL